jgi:hypothetical protein
MNELDVTVNFTYVICVTSYDVTFNVDMNALSTFDPLTQEVYVSGGDLATGGIGVYERWAQPGTNSDFLMTDLDVDGIYTLTLTGVEAGDYEYKYFWIDAGVPSWDNGYPASNMSFTVVDADLTLDDQWLVSINELNNQIIAYPNPSNGLFTLTVDGQYIAKVYDVTGRIITMSNISAANNTIDLSAQNSGMYFIQLVGENIINLQVIVK